MATYEWYTPDAVFNELNSEFSFDLDPCATPKRLLCPNNFTASDDGLTKPWFGSVFCNPPYAAHMLGKWVKKCHDEIMNNPKVSVVVALVPNSTQTKWFHNYVYGKQEIRFIEGRIQFLTEDLQPSTNNPVNSMIVVFRKNGVE